MNNENIHNASEAFASAVEAELGEGTKVFIGYVYFDPKEESWQSGDAGNLDMLGAVGAAKMILNGAENYLKPDSNE